MYIIHSLFEWARNICYYMKLFHFVIGFRYVFISYNYIFHGDYILHLCIGLFALLLTQDHHPFFKPLVLCRGCWSLQNKPQSWFSEILRDQWNSVYHKYTDLVTFTPNRGERVHNMLCLAGFSTGDLWKCCHDLNIL